MPAFNPFNSHHFEWILRAEGGHTANKNDRGGETKYGISKRAYPSLDIANLTLEDAQEIYRVDYYDSYFLGELPKKLGLVMFDTLVNHNPKTATRMLQQAVGATPDGIIGSKTLAKANKAKEQDVIEKISAARMKLYREIAESSPSQEQFLDGWNNRIIRLLQYTYTDFEA